MPNRPVHDIAGFVAGAVVGVRSARAADSPRPELEVAAAVLGGFVGSRVPDWLEPARVGPRHRALAHDVATGVLIAKLPVEEWQRRFRRLGATHEERAKSHPGGSWQQIFEKLLAHLFYALAGCLGGLRAGYLSHLALDFSTPYCLPLLGL